jgi:mannose-1-phosphate guanylyltransferase
MTSSLPSPLLHAVVIAGGSGTRFWPLSRRSHPKQLLNLSGQDTLLHATFARVQSLVPAERWWMVVGESHAAGCREVAPEVPASQVLVEPKACNTAPAITLAALHLQHAAPAGSLMVVLPADHHVRNAAKFCQALRSAAVAAQAGHLVTLGIKPTHPETGYGYIAQGAALSVPSAAGQSAPEDRIFAVERFCEKPDLKRAKAFLQQGNFVWNAGIFVMRPDVYLAEVGRLMPELLEALEPVRQALGTPAYAAALGKAYAAIKGVSIDYGVMEKAQQVAVVPVDCGWSDVGSWSALGSVAKADANGNVVRGQAVILDSSNCVVYAPDGHLVGMVGVKDMVVVHTPDATLVVPMERAQEVRDVLEKIGAAGLVNWL